MSATGTKLQLADARRIAAGLLSRIRGEALVVGSIRRGVPEVGDVEIALHVDAYPVLEVCDPGSLFTAEFQTVKGGKQGWRYWQLRHVAEGYVVDLFRFDDLNRGSITLIRTGPARFSERFVTYLYAQGLVHSKGYVRSCAADGPIVPCPTERDAFRLAAIPWLEPEART